MKATKIVLTGTLLTVAAGFVLAGCSSGGGEVGRGSAWHDNAATETTAGGRWTASRSMDPETDSSTVEPVVRGGRRAATVPGEDVIAAQPNVDAAVVTLHGSLASNGTEWFLEGEDESVQLGFGPPSYREELAYELQEGASATIRGRVADTGEIQVITCESGGTVMEFRSEEGTAMWSGRYQMDLAARSSGANSSAGGGRGRAGSVSPRGGSGRQI